MLGKNRRGVIKIGMAITNFITSGLGLQGDFLARKCTFDN